MKLENNYVAKNYRFLNCSISLVFFLHLLGEYYNTMRYEPLLLRQAVVVLYRKKIPWLVLIYTVIRDIRYTGYGIKMVS